MVNLLARAPHGTHGRRKPHRGGGGLPVRVRWWSHTRNPDACCCHAAGHPAGTGTRRTVNVDPGRSITLKLVPGATKTHEPADRFVPPIGQGRGRDAATSVPSTVPVAAVIYQGTEPQTLRADIRLALSTIGGESGQCVLVGSTASANTYPN